MAHLVFMSLISREKKGKCSCHELYPQTRIQKCTKHEIQQTFQMKLKDLQNITLQFKHKSNFPELHAQFLCVTSSDMQGEMWLVHKSLNLINHSHGSSSQTLFFTEPITAGNTSAFARKHIERLNCMCTQSDTSELHRSITCWVKNNQIWKWNHIIHQF